MIEIGTTRNVQVRTVKIDGGKRTFVPKIGTDGQPETKIVAKEVTRVTRNTLDGTFCDVRGHRLVVRLRAGDVLSLRPEKTRRELTAPLAEVYRWMIQRKANIEVLAKAREKKARKAQQRESQRVARADARIRREARAAKPDAWDGYSR